LIEHLVVGFQDSKLRFRAVNAVHQISQWLDARHPQILGQTPSEVSHWRSRSSQGHSLFYQYSWM